MRFQCTVADIGERKEIESIGYGIVNAVGKEHLILEGFDLVFKGCYHLVFGRNGKFKWYIMVHFQDHLLFAMEYKNDFAMIYGLSENESFTVSKLLSDLVKHYTF